MLGTTQDKISIINKMTFCIFWFYLINWVAVGRLTGFDKEIKVVRTVLMLRDSYLSYSYSLT